MPPLPGQPPRPPRKGGKLPWILVALAVLIGLFLLFRDGGTGDGSGRITFGTATHLTSEILSPQGGTLTLSKAGSTLDGMTLAVPAGAYEANTTFEIKETEIRSQSFGDLFTPVTPLITIDNGHGFAEVPMRLTIPIKKSDDEFAMGFYYDREAGTLEGIPATELTNGSITLLTSHFSDIIVSKVRTDRIMDDVDTGFLPGRDDIQAPNNGSWLNPFGHCAGQTYANIVYWKYHKSGRIGWDTPLSHRFDNMPGREKTMTFTQDDALVQRLASMVHGDYSHNRSSAHRTPLAQHYIDSIGAKDRNTFYAFAYAMSLTGMPQMMAIWGNDPKDGSQVGHAILIYGISGTTVRVCDPNYPGSERAISFDPSGTDNGGNAGGAFAAYHSGLNAAAADANSVPFQRFGYMGISAFINVAYVTEVWLDAMETGGKNKIDPYFPTDRAMQFISGYDAAGTSLLTALNDGTRIPAAALAIPDGPGTLWIAPDIVEKGITYHFYLGTELAGSISGIGADVGKYACIPLPKGKTDLGIMTTIEREPGQDSYTNFRRYMVVVGDASLTVSPETATIAAGDIVNFSTTLAGTIEKPLYVWDFNDGTEAMQGNLPEMPHLYEKDGSFTGTVSVREESDPSTVLADATFSIEVGAPPSETPEPEAGGAYAGTWAVNYTNTEECQHTSGIQQVEHGLRYSEIGGGGSAYMNVPLTMDLQIADENVTDNGNGTITIVIGGIENITLVGTVAADGSISGTITDTYGQGRHWIKGTFRMVRK